MAGRRFPKTMTDFVQLQNDVTHALLSVASLSKVNVHQLRKLRQDSAVSVDAIWQTKRGGCCGAGILVEMPEADVDKPNVEGPLLSLLVPCLVVEEPNLNFAPQIGTFLSAEEIAQWILDALHLLTIDGVGVLRAEGRVIQPAEEFPNLVAYRVKLKLLLPRGQTQRSGFVTISIAGGLCTLACVTTPTAILRYTTDGSFPGQSNPAAQIYEAPFAVESGEVVRAASALEGYNLSAVRQSTAP